MSHLQPELVLLNESIVEMMDMVSRQLERARLAVIEHRYDLAQEVLALEKKVNGMELKIDKDCENILALYNPVAIDLRFVMASMKINSNLERIGDNAESIAHYISHGNPKIPADFLNAFRIDEMFLMVISMINDVKKGFVE
ncbi:MAG: phosphate transport system regulatory protein PhoU, partial [Flavobacteriales bacterium]|nr:phosphate transport system regulatory protein PhoU [Flavobacteriales bacterium]